MDFDLMMPFSMAMATVCLSEGSTNLYPSIAVSEFGSELGFITPSSGVISKST